MEAKAITPGSKQEMLTKQVVEAVLKGGLTLEKPDDSAVGKTAEQFRAGISDCCVRVISLRKSRAQNEIDLLNNIPKESRGKGFEGSIKRIRQIIQDHIDLDPNTLADLIINRLNSG